MRGFDWLYRRCLEAAGDPEKCAVGVRVAELAEEAEGCMQEEAAVSCFKKCMERCGGGEACAELCRAAVDVAAAKGVAKDVLKGAVEAVIESNLAISVPEAVALTVSNLLASYVGEDCAAKTSLFRVMSMVVVEMRNLVNPDLMLLLAPLISAVHDCVGEEADDFLEEVKAAVGEQEAARIAAALDSGEVAINRVAIRFPPVR